MQNRAPRPAAGAIHIGSDRLALRHRMPATQRTADTLQSHLGLRLFAAHPSPLGGHPVVERGKVSRAKPVGNLIAECVSLRFRRQRCTRSRRAGDEGVDHAGQLRLRKEGRNAIGKGREEIKEKPLRLIGRGLETKDKRGYSARELLRVFAAQFGLFARHATAAHSELEARHFIDADARQGFVRRESTAGTAAAPSGPSR